MTKKHFKALAKAFHETKAKHDTNPGYHSVRMDQWRKDINLVADVCAQANPCFDRAKFLQACENGLQYGKEKYEAISS